MITLKTKMPIICAIKRHGFAKAFMLLPKNITHSYRWYLDKSFDRRHDTNTSGVVPLEKLSIDSLNAVYGVYYEPTSTRLFRFMMDKLSIDHGRCVFVDLGSGKGRTLLLASEFPFIEIVGVEFSKELSQIANQNIENAKNLRQRCHNVSALHMDAADYQFPLTDLLIYFYNPFGPEIMLRVLENLKVSLGRKPRNVVILYFNSLSAMLFEQQEFLPFSAEIRLPYDWTRARQRTAMVYSNFQCLPGTKMVVSHMARCKQGAEGEL